MTDRMDRHVDMVLNYNGPFLGDIDVQTRLNNEITYSHVLGQYDPLPELLVQFNLVVLELLAQLLPVTRDLHQVAPVSICHVTLTKCDPGLTFRLDREHRETVRRVYLLGEIQGRRARLEGGEGRLEQCGWQLVTSASC